MSLCVLGELAEQVTVCTLYVVMYTHTTHHTIHCHGMLAIVGWAQNSRV